MTDLPRNEVGYAEYDSNSNIVVHVTQPKIISDAGAKSVDQFKDLILGSSIGENQRKNDGVVSLLTNPPPRVIIDLGAVHLFSSGALNSLIELDNALMSNGGQHLIIANPKYDIEQNLSITRLDRFFDVRKGRLEEISANVTSTPPAADSSAASSTVASDVRAGNANTEGLKRA